MPDDSRYVISGNHVVSIPDPEGPPTLAQLAELKRSLSAHVHTDSCYSAWDVCGEHHVCNPAHCGGRRLYCTLRMSRLDRRLLALITDYERLLEIHGGPKT